MKKTINHSMIHDFIRYGLYVLLIFSLGIGLLLTHAFKYPSILALAILAFTFGLRHAFDIDHIAAIDNMTRKLLNDKKNAHGVGFSFSFGHSLVVIMMTIITVLLVQWAKKRMPDLNQFGAAIGTFLAGMMLIILAVVNMFIIRSIWLNFKHSSEENKKRGTEGPIYHLFTKSLSLINHNWQVMIVGFIFGLGFDSATQVAVLATSVAAADKGLPWMAIMSIPVMFTAGMCLMDTCDGLFMSTAYSWVFSSPFRKLYYNLVITTISVISALTIGLIDLYQSISVVFHWHNATASWISQLDFNKMGIALVLLFACTWAATIIFWRLFSLDKYDK
ncbi:MAG: HoxN/HupN/NixA family nickel/cobalt transporter [Oenococcus sp.]|nr:HoxN/HupN/NixA family nickel/cobalt transporter [Oenococcus kitaharae]MCV3296762.1 HoxN/HupN/NixA family nickel/cobalt transporter [Oenococcus kitaharae]